MDYEHSCSLRRRPPECGPIDIVARWRKTCLGIGPLRFPRSSLYLCRPFLPPSRGPVRGARPPGLGVSRLINFTLRRCLRDHGMRKRDGGHRGGREGDGTGRPNDRPESGREGGREIASAGRRRRRERTRGGDGMSGRSLARCSTQSGLVRVEGNYLDNGQTRDSPQRAALII